MSTTTGATTTPRPLRILMLHGYTQSGSLFRAKTRALEKNLQKAFPPPTYNVSLIYPTAPIKIRAADIPDFSSPGSPIPGSTSVSGTSTPGGEKEEEDPDAWGWWVRRGAAEPHFTYEGIERGLASVAEILERDGPFDGVVGFSQGAALAGMVASLLEPGRIEAWNKMATTSSSAPTPMMPYPDSFLRPGESTGYVEDDPIPVHPPLKFAVSYSGFGANNSLYKGFYEPKIATPMLHFIGSVDTVVEEERSLRLVRSCVDGEGKNGKRVVRHPGGHFLPSQKQYVAALVDFVRESMGWNEHEGRSGSQAQTNIKANGTTNAAKGKGNEDDLDDFPF